MSENPDITPDDESEEWEQVFLHKRVQVPITWVEGNKDKSVPVAEFYGSPLSLLNKAALASELGLNVELSTYCAPVGKVDNSDYVDEAHLTVWKRVESDASLQPHQWYPDKLELDALLQVAGAARSYRVSAKVGKQALMAALEKLDEAQGRG